MNENLSYVSYGNVAVIYNSESNTFCIQNKGKPILKDCKLSNICDATKTNVEHSFDKESNFLIVTYQKEDGEISLKLKVNKLGVLITSSKSATISGRAYWGENIKEDTFAMQTAGKKGNLRCAIGPAASNADNSLYDRNTDSAIVTDGKIKFKYNYENNCYDFILHAEKENEVMFYIKENVIANKYKIEFGRINKNSTFKKPPAGWMTWYAVKFDAWYRRVVERTWGLRFFGCIAFVGLLKKN